MKKRKLKKSIKLSLGVICSVFVIAIFSAINMLSPTRTKNVSNMKDNYTYVNDYIFDSYYPVINQEEKLKVSKKKKKVTLYRHYYDKDSNEDIQTKSS